MREMVNPYIAGAPVTETKMFFGREDVFDWIERSLTGRYADHILVIHGQRRVGKTSVLKQLHNRLPERYIPVFFDFQGRTHTTLDRFRWWPNIGDHSLNLLCETENRLVYWSPDLPQDTARPIDNRAESPILDYRINFLGHLMDLLSWSNVISTGVL
jgi:hypothetical protein